MQNSSKRKKRIYGFLFFVLFIATVLLFVTYKAGQGSVSPPSEILLKEVKVEKDFIVIKGMTENSAKGYKGYQYKTEGENGYLQLSYGLFGKNNFGDFDIKLTKKGNIKAIYLQGEEKKNTKLIWEKEKK